jgi:hypothetical protein
VALTPEEEEEEALLDREQNFNDTTKRNKHGLHLPNTSGGGAPWRNTRPLDFYFLNCIS